MSAMRIGTWNLAGRWDGRHAALLLDQDCDVWLLTEVHVRLEIRGYAKHPTESQMGAHKHWSAVLSRWPMDPLPDPHPASSAAVIGGTTYCSSILPWRSCGNAPPWVGGGHGAKMEAALATLTAALRDVRLIWGGDWNQGLCDDAPDWAGSARGRRAVLATVDDLGLEVPTAELPHCLPGNPSIDHIAVPAGWTACARHVVAEHGGVRLSDHDAYVVELAGADPAR